MSVTINAKGTSTSSFMIGKNGAIIGQDGTITPPPGGNVTLNLDPDAGLVLAAGVGPSLITSTDNLDLHINPATGGGQYLVLCANRWPATDGTSGQVLTTNGSGIASWQNTALAAPKYEEYVATSSQTVFSTTMTTIAKSGGRAYLQVFVNGVFQQEGSTKAFTVTGGNQITFNSGIAENANVVIYGFA